MWLPGRTKYTREKKHMTKQKMASANSTASAMVEKIMAVVSATWTPCASDAWSGTQLVQHSGPRQLQLETRPELRRRMSEVVGTGGGAGAGEGVRRGV